MDGIIDCETHYFSDGFLELLRSRKTPPRQEVHGGLRKYFPEPTAPDVAIAYPAVLEENLLDLGDSRIALMDQHGIAAQVVSLTTPGTDVFELDLALKQAREANDVLGAAVARHPDRFIGFATLAPFGGDESARELERCVVELGFRGVNIHSHVGDRYLDDRSCWPIFEAAQRLDVPINVHPTLPLGTMLAPYLGYGWTLSGPGLGFGHEVAVQVSRMIYAGVFDTYPDLQLMLGHCGEALPFWMYRLDFPYIKPYIDVLGDHPNLDRKPSEYLVQNCWYNCSGNFFNPALLACLSAVGSDRLMFGSDHPYESYDEACQYLATMPVSEPDRVKIASTNARRLFKLDAVSAD
ncbi:amidohydrolase family protein [Streptomyces sp. NPDC058464]|uniref:amidohydrolase family protein n=1 Tax=Streptomyces sp. NPDC058464 TaxID=3346511 RepID=UPI0036598424